jgi:hypothetical protein
MIQISLSTLARLATRIPSTLARHAGLISRPFMLFVFCVLAVSACGQRGFPVSFHHEPDPGPVSFPDDLPPDTTISAGTMRGAFSVSSTGEAMYRGLAPVAVAVVTAVVAGRLAGAEAGAAEAGTAGNAARAATSGGRVRAYEVGKFDALKARSGVGDGLDLHHVGQAHAMEQIVPGYNRGTGPAIALPRAEHAAVPTLRGPVSMSPRSLLARDIWNLRQYTNAPTSSLQQLIQLNKGMFPGAFAK